MMSRTLQTRAARQQQVEAKVAARLSDIKKGDALTYPRPNTNLRSYNEWEFRNNDPATPGLINFYNRYKGKRCFVIGNGPSLNKHDLSLLKDEYVFAVNSFYYKTKETGFKPTFFVVEDEMVMKENYEEFRSYDVPYKFFPTEYKEYHPPADNVFYFRMNHGFYQDGNPYYNVPRFSSDPMSGLYCGQSVTYINLQLAFFMGFSEVYLIGMDFNYIIPKEHKRTGNDIVSTTDDPNHFHKDYFGVGKTWRDPKLENVAMNYRQAKVSYEAVGRKIYNATVGGHLEIFERVDYYDLLTGDGRPAVKPAQDDQPSSPSALASNSGGAASDLGQLEGPVSKPEPAQTSTARAADRPKYRTGLGWLLRRLLELPPPVLALLLAGGVGGALAGSLMAPPPFGQALIGLLAVGALAGIGFLALRLRGHIQTLSSVARNLSQELEAATALAAQRERYTEQLIEAQRMAVEKANNDIRSELQLARDQVRSTDNARAELTRRVEGELQALQGRLSADRAAVERRLEAELAKHQASLDAATSDQRAVLDAAMSNQRSALEAAISSQRSALEAVSDGFRNQLNQLRVEQEAKLAADLEEVESRFEQVIKKRAASTRASMARSVQATRQRERALEERLTASADQLSSELQSLVVALRGELEAVAASVPDQAEALRDALTQDLASLARRMDAHDETVKALEEETGSRSKAQAEEFQKQLRDVERELRAEVQSILERSEQRMEAVAASVPQQAEALRDALTQDLASLARRMDAHDETVKALEEETGSRSKAQAEELQNQLRDVERELRADVQSVLERSEQRMNEVGLEDLPGRIDSAAAELRNDLRIVRDQVGARLDAAGVDELNAVLSRSVQDVRDEVKAVREGLEQRMHAEIAEITASSSEGTEKRLNELVESTMESLRDEISIARQAVEGRLASELAELGEKNISNEQFEAVKVQLEAEFKALTDSAVSNVKAEIASETAKLSEDLRAAAAGYSEEALKTAIEKSKEETQAVALKLNSEISSLSTGLDQTKAFSLPTVSFLRTFRPRPDGESAVSEMAQKPEFEHGHELMMAILADREASEPGSLSNRSLIEIGSTREVLPTQGSTQKLGLTTAILGMRFTTVDMDPANTAAAAKSLSFINPAANAITARGEVYLGKAERLEFIYLDAFDFDHDNHSQKRREAYKANLGVDISDEACWEMHLACARLIAARLADDGVLVLDDTWTASDGGWAGKGKSAIPYLLDADFEIMARTKQTVALRRRS